MPAQMGLWHRRESGRIADCTHTALSRRPRLLTGRRRCGWPLARAGCKQKAGQPGTRSFPGCGLPPVPAELAGCASAPGTRGMATVLAARHLGSSSAFSESLSVPEHCQTLKTVTRPPRVYLLRVAPASARDYPRSRGAVFPSLEPHTAHAHLPPRHLVCLSHGREPLCGQGSRQTAGVCAVGLLPLRNTRWTIWLLD